MGDGEQTMDDVQINTNESYKQMLSRFYKMQEERVQTYKLFDEGFQAYLKSAPNYNFPMYRQLVYEITQTFTNISKDILAIKEKFSECNKLSSVATLIGKVQEAEQKKLEMTAKLQLSEQKIIDEPESESAEEDIESLKQSLRENQELLVEYLDELKYESEDLYGSESESVPSSTEVDR